MIVITGSARCGTSMLMQTLILLGVKTPSKPFIREHKDIIQYNPKGFYEMYDEVVNGIDHHNYKGQCVKLFAGLLNLSNLNYVDKVIVCKRNRSDAIKSYKPIDKIIPTKYSPEFIYDTSFALLDKILPQLNHIFINFEEIRSNPKDEIKRIIEFLDIQPTEKEIINAIKNIDLCHY